MTFGLNEYMSKLFVNLLICLILINSLYIELNKLKRDKIN